MSRLHELLASFTKVQDLAARRSFEEVKEIVRKLESLIEASTNKHSVLQQIGAEGDVWLSYPFALFGNDQLWPDGIEIGAPCRIIEAEVVSDPTGGPASADTTFILKNKPSSPTSAGPLTILSGQRRGINSSLGVKFAVGQRLYVDAPASPGTIQNLYTLRIKTAPF